MLPPYYRIVRFTGPQTFEPTGETWPYNSDAPGETFDELNARLAELSAETGAPHGAEVVWQ
jgi:hypothetical protein